MPHSKQAQKRVRTDDQKRIRNKTTRSAMRGAIKKVRQAEGEAVETALSRATKRIDKAAKAGVIHKNAAARKKSRLAKAANKAS